MAAINVTVDLDAPAQPIGSELLRMRQINTETERINFRTNNHADRSRSAGKTGAKPKPQLPIATVVTPCHPDSEAHLRDSRLEWPIRHGFIGLVVRGFHAGKKMFPPDAS
jgi:hypothetical protein